jgi:hypothetical protein
VFILSLPLSRQNSLGPVAKVVVLHDMVLH